MNIEIKHLWLHKCPKKWNQYTLIALVITIIVLLILAGVTIVILTGDNGLIGKGYDTKNTNFNAEIEEHIGLAYQEWQIGNFTNSSEITIENFIRNQLNNIYGDGIVTEVNKIGNAFMITFSDEKIYTYNLLNGKLTDLSNKSNISKSSDENFIGYYADIDADGIIDGVIFADLLLGDTNEKYTIPKEDVDDLKNYYISQEEYKWAKTKETKPVLSPKGSGKNRFYIMSLNNFTASSYNTFYWYKNATGKINDYNTVTSENFGSGKENTEKMIAKWNMNDESGGYKNATKDEKDIWKHIQMKFKEGWFIPSNEEWAAFLNKLEIKNDYNSTYELDFYYWTSSLNNAWYAYKVMVADGKMIAAPASNTNPIRLIRTF